MGAADICGACYIIKRIREYKKVKSEIFSQKGIDEINFL